MMQKYQWDGNLLLNKIAPVTSIMAFEKFRGKIDKRLTPSQTPAQGGFIPLLPVRVGTGPADFYSMVQGSQKKFIPQINRD